MQYEESKKNVESQPEQIIFKMSKNSSGFLKGYKNNILISYKWN